MNKEGKKDGKKVTYQKPVLKKYKSIPKVKTRAS